MDANDSFLRDAEDAWDAICERAEIKDIWIGDQIAHYWQSVTADDLKIAFGEDCEDTKAITDALAFEDDAALGKECRRAINRYFRQNAEIDWEARNA